MSTLSPVSVQSRVAGPHPRTQSSWGLWQIETHPPRREVDEEAGPIWHRKPCPLVWNIKDTPARGNTSSWGCGLPEWVRGPRSMPRFDCWRAAATGLDTVVFWLKRIPGKNIKQHHQRETHPRGVRGDQVQLLPPVESQKLCPHAFQSEMWCDSLCEMLPTREPHHRLRLRVSTGGWSHGSPLSRIHPNLDSQKESECSTQTTLFV